MSKPKISKDLFDLTSADAFIRGGKPPSPFAGMSRKRRQKIKQVLNSTNRGDRGWWTRYERYINSDRWRAFRERIFRERGVCCERCGVSGSVKQVHLHHISYSNVFREAPEDVKVYCVDCHRLMHPNKKIASLR